MREPKQILFGPNPNVKSRQHHLIVFGQANDLLSLALEFRLGAFELGFGGRSILERCVTE
jgi:hypothetical protein